MDEHNKDILDTATRW